jgi:hypothetical protein
MLVASDSKSRLPSVPLIARLRGRGVLRQRRLTLGFSPRGAN